MQSTVVRGEKISSCETARMSISKFPDHMRRTKFNFLATVFYWLKLRTRLTFDRCVGVHWLACTFPRLTSDKCFYLMRLLITLLLVLKFLLLWGLWALLMLFLLFFSGRAAFMFSHFKLFKMLQGNVMI